MLFTLVKLLLQLSIVVLYLLATGAMVIGGYFVYLKTGNIILVAIAEVVMFKLLGLIIKLWRAFVYGE